MSSDSEQRSWAQEFASWHRGPSLYREVYARALATLIAALVIYLVAAVSGVLTRRPLVLLGPITVAFGLFSLWVRLQLRLASIRVGENDVVLFPLRWTPPLLIVVGGCYLTYLGFR